MNIFMAPSVMKSFYKEIYACEKFDTNGVVCCQPKNTVEKIDPCTEFVFQIKEEEASLLYQVANKKLYYTIEKVPIITAG